MSFDYLHEVEVVSFQTDSPQQVAPLAALLESLGFTLHDDVYSLDRVDKVQPWQHGSIVEVEMLLDGKEVFDLEGEWNSLKLKYLLAFLPADYICIFVDSVFAVARELNLSPVLGGEVTTRDGLLERLSAFAQDLESELGEQPGSEGLAIIIHGTYPRPRENPT